MIKIPCVYMRGGTSKAVFFHREDLPEDEQLWPALFMKVMGTPDKKQIDGMGGAHPTTSKIAVISKAKTADHDIDYSFFQVAVEEPYVDTRINCGNISCAVGPYAVDEGLVAAVEPVTIVRVYNTNTGKYIEEHVPVRHGRALAEGQDRITGVPGTGAGMRVFFMNPGGATTGRLFPTGNRRDVLKPEGYTPVEVTMIDCSNPVTFVRAEDLGLSGTEISNFTQDAELLRHIEAIRAQAAVCYGYVQRAEDAAEKSLARPKVSVFSPPQDYMGSHHEMIRAESMDICSRVVSVGVFHKTHPITSGIAIASAAAIPGTVVHDCARHTGDSVFRVGHPYGVLPIEVQVEGEHVIKGGTIRTARRIMDGNVYIPETV